MAFRCLLAPIAVLALQVACRPVPSSAVDPELAACVPSDTLVLSGVHLDSLRASATFQKLAAHWAPLLEPLRDASSVLVAYNGRDFLFIARGSFPTAPAGAVLLTPQLALAGSAASVRVATAQHAGGKTGTPSLLAYAEPVASRPIWAVVPGNVPLRLAGNRANFARLLGFTEHATLTANFNTGITLEAAGICRTEDSARSLEETLRGLISLAAGTTRNRSLAAVLASIQIRRETLTVRAELSASPASLELLLREAIR